MNQDVYMKRVSSYDYDEILSYIFRVISSLRIITPGQSIILKPNWVKESHLYRPNDWDYVITHPIIITAVLEAALRLLNGKGAITVTDGPQTDSSFKKIMRIMQPNKWVRMGTHYGVPVKVLDLREDEWVNVGDITVDKRKLPGDPKGSTEINLEEEVSEFFGHKKSVRGYYGADYDIHETNRAHDGHNNLYRVSKTVIESDVFINIPKMKTHKKAGITCCLKNLVGINTYKNFLPHHNEGSAVEGGDQFPGNKVKNRIEGRIMAKLKQGLLQNQKLAPLFIPVKKVGKKIFGSTEEVVRSGNWHGNDTLWRMILDLNKILFFSNPDGTMREPFSDNKKKYIGVVDGVYAGEGNGPMAPDKRTAGVLIAGTCPVGIDCVCAKLMGFDYHRFSRGV